MRMDTRKIVKAMTAMAVICIVLAFSGAAYLDRQLLNSPLAPNYATGQTVKASVKSKIVYATPRIVRLRDLSVWVIAGSLGVVGVLIWVANRLEPNHWFDVFYKRETSKLEGKHWGKLDREP